MTDTPINIPFKIVRNPQGKIINFPEGGYFHYYPNRAQRRNKPERFTNNRNSANLTISGVTKYRRVFQTVYNKSKQELIKIYHYLIN